MSPNIESKCEPRLHINEDKIFANFVLLNGVLRLNYVKCDQTIYISQIYFTPSNAFRNSEVSREN